MKDYLISATAFDGTIDIVAVETTNISNTAKEYHNLSCASEEILSKVMTASFLMSNFMKSDNEVLTVEVNSSGEFGKIISVVNANLEVRGYIDNTKVKLLADDKIEDKVGIDGYIKVIKDMRLKEPYIGISKTRTGDIAKDLIYYYSVSEQIPTYVVLSHVRGDNELARDCGMMLQVMPDVKGSTIKYIKDNMGKIGLFEEMIKKGNKLENVLIDIFKDGKLKFKTKRSCEYKCNCSRDKMKGILISLGKKEIEDLIEDRGEANIECHFCNKTYEFKDKELREILDKIKR